MRLYTYLTLSLIIIASCSSPKDDVYTTFGSAFDNKESVYQFKYDPEFSGEVYHEIPDLVCELYNLKSFEMVDADLTSIPDCMAGMTSIGTLILDKNELNSLPNNIGDMEGLFYLSLVGNKLSFIPESMGELSKLGRLYLRGNNLRTLPSSIGNLNRLEILDLAFNNFSANEKSRIEKLLPNCEIIWD